MDGNSNLNNKMSKSHLGKDHVEKKKMLHRDIERQRRQEMATLYSHLRSLLPLQYIKGKRAVSEHINGAVNYIKDLQKRIEELSAKKEELKRVLDFKEASSSCNSLLASAIVRPCLGGFEVVVSSNGVQVLKLSRLLELLLLDGLDVVSYVSTKIGEGYCHTIRCEVIDDLSFLDASMLQEKLNEAIRPGSQSFLQNMSPT